MDDSRIPYPADDTRAGAARWFEQMDELDLLFHPDDDPADIIRIADGRATFTALECTELRGIVARLFECHGAAVYEIGVPFFLRHLPIEERWLT